MSGASITSEHSSTDSASSDEWPQQEGTVRPTNDEKENDRPSVVTSPGISYSGPPQPTESHVQEITSPEGAFAAEEQKVVGQEGQPSPSEIAKFMKEVLDILKDSTIVSKTDKDTRSRFWAAYKRVAEEHDNEFLYRYNDDMKTILVFSGLFSAVNATFIMSMESSLSPDPNDTTQALLTQLVQIGLGNFTAAGSTPAAPASTWSPNTATIRIQCIAYASLSFSLLAAFGAVLGKQWLGYYKSERYGHGSEEEREKCRQKRLDGIDTWYFEAVMQSFPILLQFSLLLFGISLGANMWYEQHSIAWVIIATTVFGFSFYSLTVMASLVSLTCPFQTPISATLRKLRIDHVLAACGCCFQSLFGAFQRLLHWRRSLTRGPDLENRNRNPENQYLKHTPPTSSLEARCVKWLTETSTDPEVFYATASFVPHVDWPLNFDVSASLRLLYNVYTTCLDVQGHIVPSLEEKASTCTMALCHLYCNHILQGHPPHVFLGEGSEDRDVFRQILGRTKLNYNVLVATTKLFDASYGPPSDRQSSPKFGACPDDDYVLQWLSHVLPFHFAILPKDKDARNLAMTVISKLLSSPSFPSPQIAANCALLACVMCGVLFDKKDIIRVDKSDSLPQLAESLWMKIQTALGSSDGGGPSGAIRREWRFNYIRQKLGHDVFPPPLMWKLGVCLKIYSRAMSSQGDAQNSSAALQKVQRFWFHVKSSRPASSRPASSRSVSPLDPAWLWEFQISWQGISPLPEDFDWLVDYLGDVCSNDYETAGDILVLLSSMTVSCSSAKQYIKKLVTCMGSSDPRLRHAALRAAHGSREVLASIEVSAFIDVVVAFSPAILIAVRPQPGATPASTNDGHDRFFHPDRDLCYLELVFALAKNEAWEKYLFGDYHIARCRSIAAECCRSNMYISSNALRPYAFYIVGIFLQLSPAPGHTFIELFDDWDQRELNIIWKLKPKEEMERQLGQRQEWRWGQEWEEQGQKKKKWQHMVRNAWHSAPLTTGNTHCVERLYRLAEETKEFMECMLEAELRQLIEDVGYLIGNLERQGLLEQGERIAISVKDLRDLAKNKLKKFRK